MYPNYCIHAAESKPGMRSERVTNKNELIAGMMMCLPLEVFWHIIHVGRSCCDLSMCLYAKNRLIPARRRKKEDGGFRTALSSRSPYDSNRVFLPQVDPTATHLQMKPLNKRKDSESWKQ